MKGSSRRIHLKDCSFKKNGKKYSYYALAESQKSEGKNQKSIIKYLGALSKNQVESYRYALRSINDGKGSLVDVDDLVFSERKDFLDVAALHHLWNHLDLNSAFDAPPIQSRKSLDTMQIAEILTLSKLLKPSSNIGTVDWFQETSLAELMGINPDKYNRMKIFNELSSIADHKESIERRLFEIARHQNKTDFSIYFVDGTTTYFEGTHCELGRKGKDKTTGYKTHMILILLVTDRSGYPCAWDVYSGNEKEISNFRNLAKRICQTYKITDITFCFDRGFASVKNFEAIEGFLSRFISGIDKNQIAKVFDVEQFQDTKQKILDYTEEITNRIPEPKTRRFPIDGFYTADRKRYYKDLGEHEAYRYIAGFSIEIFKAERETRERAQLNVFLKLGDLNTELASAKKNRDLDVIAKQIDKILETNKMQGLISYSIVPCSVKCRNTTIQSCSIQYALDIEAWNKAGLLDGIFVYITDHTEKDSLGSYEMSAYDVTRHYKDKYVIEQNFRDLKNVINIRPLFVRLTQHVHALINISIIAQFINVFLTQKLSDIGMSVNEFYSLLNKSSSVAVLKTPKRTLKKLIKTQPKLIKALETIGVKSSVFSSNTMAILK